MVDPDDSIKSLVEICSQIKGKKTWIAIYFQYTYFWIIQRIEILSSIHTMVACYKRDLIISCSSKEKSFLVI